MADFPAQDAQQAKLEKAVTKMPKPKELAPPDFAQDKIPAPGSGPFGTALTGAGSIPSAPSITPNVTGDKTPQALLTSTTDIGKQTTNLQKQPMKMARYALSRRMKFRDLNISVETDKGEKRHWYDPHNKEKGTTTMKNAYGYIRRTKGVDGDHVDVYVGPNEQAENAYIIHQMKAPEFTKYDEDKCMIGFDSAEAAKKAYLAHYNSPKFFGSMTTMSFDNFKTKVLKSFDLKQPHKIAEAIMNPHLKTAYLHGAGQAKIAFEKETAELAPATAPTSVPIASTASLQPNVLGGMLDTAESGLGSLYDKGKAGLGKAYSAGESGLDQLLAALKQRQPEKTPEEKKEASAALVKALLAAGGIGGAGLGANALLQGSQVGKNVSGARTNRGLEATLGKEGQAMPGGEAMLPPDQAAADTGMPPEASPEDAAAPNLGDPNFWGGGAAASPEAAAAGAQSAEEVIGLLPAGTFQGMNVRITPDGQKSTGLKVTPEAIDAPDALKAVFAAEPSARIEITTPDTPSSVTSFKEGADAAARVAGLPL